MIFVDAEMGNVWVIQKMQQSIDAGFLHLKKGCLASGFCAPGNDVGEPWDSFTDRVEDVRVRVVDRSIGSNLGLEMREVGARKVAGNGFRGTATHRYQVR